MCQSSFYCQFSLFTGLPNLLLTAGEGNVFTGVCHSVHNWPYGYSVTVHPCYSTVGVHPTGMLSILVILFFQNEVSLVKIFL